MKFINIFTFVVIAISILASCKKDDENNSGYEFKNQNLQGKIGNVAWQLNSGNAEDDGSELDIDLWVVNETDPCNVLFGDSTRIFFGIDNVVGLTELNLDLTNIFSGQTVTFFIPDGSQNLVASEGAVEILSIDTATNLVSGRMDVTFDEETFVNGNFTIDYCN